MKAWRVHGGGRPSEVLRLDDVDLPPAGAGQLLVRTTTTVLNYNEVDGCRGRYLTINPPLPYTLGMEVVGVVESAGPGLGAWLGHRVMATAVGGYGGHAEQVLVNADMTFDAPEKLDDREAAAFFFPFHLAHLGLFERGRLEPGETVLIHAGAGGVGSAAIQLAAERGAKVIATAGGAKKVEVCRDLGADLAIDYLDTNFGDTDFVDAVVDATDGRGVDVVFDGVGGEVAERSLRCLGYGGRHMIIGFASGIEAEERPWVTPRTFCFGNFSVGGVLLSYSSDPAAARRLSGFNITPRAIGDRVQARLVGLLGAGLIHPVIGGRVAFADLPMALEEMEQRRTIGRIVVDVAAS